MNLDSLSFALSYISYSVPSLTKKNFKSSGQEISRLIALHGFEAERHLLRCLFSHVDFSGDGKSSGKDFHQTQYLIQEFSSVLSKPNFVSTVCFAIENPLHYQKSLRPSALLLPHISHVLRLNRVQEVVLGTCLLYSSSADLCNCATQFIRLKLPDLLQSYTDSDLSTQESDLQDCSPEVLHLLLVDLLNKNSEHFGVTNELKESFFENLRKDFPRDRVPVVLAPLLYGEACDVLLVKGMTEPASNMSKAMELSPIDLIKELGYGFTASVEECRQSLVQVGLRDPGPSMVARVLSMMANTHTGLSEPLQGLGSSATSPWNADKDANTSHITWNIDIFIQALYDLVPTLSWKEVVSELDFPGFFVKDRQGLKLLWHGLCRGLGSEPFPTDRLYRVWRNPDSQLSLFHQIMKNSDIVCLIDYKYRPVSMDILKALPEDDNRDIANWKSLDLVETLLNLSEKVQYSSHVHDLFKYPVQHCPDLLMLGLLQAMGPMQGFRQELLTNLVFVFLSNHPNSAIVLQAAWNVQNHANVVRPLIMHTMADWYMRGGESEQGRLSRILDVAQDLKALSVLLSSNSFPLVIDLACLASRREYLKLDKWLTDKIFEHKEAFIQACVNFLKRRCPQIMGGIVKEENLPKSAQLPAETLATMLSCLQQYAGSVSQELSETILTMSGNCSILLNKPRQPPPGVVKTPRGLEPAFSAASLNPSQAPQQQQQQQQQQQLEVLSSLGSLSMNGPTTAQAPPIGVGGGPPLFGSSFATPGSPAKLFGAPPSATGSTGPPPPAQGTGFSNVMPSLGDVASILPEMNQPVSKEIEDEANGYFQRIYNHPPHPTLSIAEVLDMLKRFQESPIKSERDVFNCMIKNLFEEYRFFPQYPEKELIITAQLFGGIIEQSLVTYMALGLALRYVLDALRKPFGTKMYYFGITALDQFKTRLKDYPQYCQHLASIPHFKDFPEHLREYVDCGARSQEPVNRPQGQTLPHNLAMLAQGLNPAGAPQSSAVRAAPAAVPTSSAGVTATTVVLAKSTTVGGKDACPSSPPCSSFTAIRVFDQKYFLRPFDPNEKRDMPSIANPTNIDTLLVATQKDDKLLIPPEAVQDKVAFIINNLSQMNLPQKTEEFKEVVKEEYWPWFAQYIVMKRASIEPNFHTLYANFLDTVKNEELSVLVLRETFRNIKVLLTSDKAIANFSDRSLLKSLGHWLGMLTIAKNRPVLQADIDLKSLLIEAYHKGQQELLYVVPFIAKVLESSAKSRVFKPPNPWTMGVLDVLSELHREPELKLNLKFEIEVLCKTLNLDINDFKPGIILKDQELRKRLDPQLSPRHKVDSPALPPSVVPPTAAPPSAAPPPLAPQVPSGVVTAAAGPGIPVAQVGLPPPQPEEAPATLGVSGTSIGAFPQPQFSYQEINVLSMTTLAQHIQINSQLPLFQAHPHLKQYVRTAIDRAIQEWIMPVVERSLKIALTTCDQIVRKDFALDPEESRLRAAAHHMVRSLTAGMAMITCRDPMLVTISNNLKAAFHTALRLQGASLPQKELLEQATTVVAQENVELACCFIQKTAIEKAIPEIDKKLSQEYEFRKSARSENRRYCDPVVLTYQAERMPEQIRLKVGGVTPQQMAVYEEFARNIPGFQPISERDQPSLFIPKPVVRQTGFASSVDDMTNLYDKIISELEQQVHGLLGTVVPSNPQVAALHLLHEAVLVARNSREAVTAMALLQKTVESMAEGLSHSLGADPETALRFREAHLAVLKTLAEGYGHPWAAKHITRFLLELREEIRWNVDVVDPLVRSGLLVLATFDLHLAQSMENGMNYPAVDFAKQLVRLYFSEARHGDYNLSESDLCNTLEALVRINAHSRQPQEGLSQVMEMLRSGSGGGAVEYGGVPSSGPMSMMHSGISQAREYDDPPGLHEKTEFLLREWVSMYNAPTAGKDSTKAFQIFVQQMNVQGILKTDDLITRFFRLSTEMCVEHCYRALLDQTPNNATIVRSKCFNSLDAYMRLIALLVKLSGDASNPTTKVNLLNKVLGIVAGVLLQDHESRGLEFQQLPYHRIFMMLFLELSAPEAVLEAIGFHVLMAFCNTLHVLQPCKAPAFAYSWLELISHRVFLGRVLALTPQQKAWGMFAQLLNDLFKFLAPFLRNVDLEKPIQLLYKGTLRVLLVLLHDFPEFLCDYHYGFCDLIPANCIQMRNLILSAFPRHMRLPDPFTPNLKVEVLPEITQAPRVLTNFASVIQPQSFKKDLDSYIKTRGPVTFLSELRSNLQATTEPGINYNVPLMNALVLYVGTQAIAYIQSKSLTPSMSTITHSSHMDIFQNLAVDLDTEGRYLFLNAIANQLRYPNSHTHYFSCTLLYLFAEANTEAIQEQITRVLLERLIVNRPHPWGLLVTFIDLIKNPTFKFWSHEFVRCAPEIEKLFESVARSCMQQKPPTEPS
ncbi:CCR4-NOT transcription complex subunit 1 isoform X1 [Rhipicephalus microplus]|uniref:CCR4-NOT transcription complex subunit 1 isoform X1 n=1 Tax=Rhipicephalus microplus TaxID=6941 RepID=UPI003F6AA1AB